MGLTTPSPLIWKTRPPYGYDLLIDVGHDEYWSAPQRRTVEDHLRGPSHRQCSRPLPAVTADSPGAKRQPPMGRNGNNSWDETATAVGTKRQ